MDTEIRYIADEETGAVTAPRPLELPEKFALEAWMPSREKFTERQTIEISAYNRNVLRISQAYGPLLIAMLSNSGALEPEQDPEQALRNVLKAAGF